MLRPVRWLAISAMLTGGAVAGLSGAGATESDEQASACLARKSPDEQAKALSWWGRRSADEKKVLLSVSCEERYIPAVCIFLYDPNLKDCTARGVAEYRAERACAAKGFKILTQEFVDCKEDWKRKAAPTM